jgi:hypothetical protein
MVTVAILSLRFGLRIRIASLSLPEVTDHGFHAAASTRRDHQARYASV